MNKELIKNYLLDKGLSDDERVERFSIAWDIGHSFEDILFELRQDLMKALKERIEENFKNYS